MTIQEIKNLVRLKYSDLEKMSDLPKGLLVVRKYNDVSDLKAGVAVKFAKALNMTVEELVTATPENFKNIDYTVMIISK